MPFTFKGSSKYFICPNSKFKKYAGPVFSNSYSVNFDGSNDYLNVSGFNPNSLIGTGDMTFSAWFKIDIDSAVQRIMYMGHPTNNEDYLTLFFRNTNNTLELSARSGDAGNAAITGSTTLSTSTWYHAAFTRTGSTCTTYLNGSQEGAVTDSEFSVALGSTFMLGTFKNVASYLDGFLDELAVWDVALDADAVTAIYNSGVPTDLTSDSGNYDNSGDLIGYWRMEENTGTSVADSSTNSNAATLTNGPTFSTDVPVAWSNDYSLSLDGTNDYALVSNNSTLTFGDGSNDSAFSISAWIKADNFSGFRILTKNEWNATTDYREYIFSAANGLLLMGLVDAAGAVGAYNNYRYRKSSSSGSLQMSTGVWYHVVGTYDGRGGTNAHEGIKLYVNNVLETNYNALTAGTYVAMHNNTGSNGDIAIGAWRNDSFTDGKIDEVAIYSTELTSTQVSNIYNSGTPTDLSSDSNLVGYWRFEENTGTSIADSSTNSNTATLTNGPTFSTERPS